MEKNLGITLLFLLSVLHLCQGQRSEDPNDQSIALNPIILADVPVMAIAKHGSTWFMSSSTMHMSPGVPIMKSVDLVNWELVTYAYDTLGSLDQLSLTHGKNAYGNGSWASCLRFHEGTWYTSTFSHTTGKTYIFSTTDIERGPWKRSSFIPAYHDHTLFFDDDGRVYIIYGVGGLKLVELNPDASGIRPGTSEKIIIENANAPAGDDIMLQAEGSQLFKINGTYYLFNITWPKEDMRTVVIHRAENITGPWEGRVALRDKGVAQGGLTDTPDGRWFAYLFRDFGSVGRIPYLVPVKWEDGWPILGIEGKVPDKLNLPASRGLIPGIVASDEFKRNRKDLRLPLVWQWNHNPDNSLWSVTTRKGWLRLTTGRVDTLFTQARNTLTQRTFGPECSGTVLIDISGMRDGDFAGLALFQKKIGQVGILPDKGMPSVIMLNAQAGMPVVAESVMVRKKRICLRAECDFRNNADRGYFFYCLDGKTWVQIGTTLEMDYSIPHFMGYRFGLFCYSTCTPGGSADFDWFRIAGDRNR